MTRCDLGKNAAEVAAADFADFIGREALFQHLAGDGIETDADMSTFAASNFFGDETALHIRRSVALAWRAA
jgi:hypothetical protein